MKKVSMISTLFVALILLFGCMPSGAADNAALNSGLELYSLMEEEELCDFLQDNQIDITMEDDRRLRIYARAAIARIETDPDVEYHEKFELEQDVFEAIRSVIKKAYGAKNGTPLMKSEDNAALNFSSSRLLSTISSVDLIYSYLKSEGVQITQEEAEAACAAIARIETDPDVEYNEKFGLEQAVFEDIRLVVNGHYGAESIYKVQYKAPETPIPQQAWNEERKAAFLKAYEESTGYYPQERWCTAGEKGQCCHLTNADGYDIIASSIGMVTMAEESINIGQWTFEEYYGFNLYAYKDGEIIPLKAAYRQGLVSDETMQAAWEAHNVHREGHKT